MNARTAVFLIGIPFVAIACGTPQRDPRRAQIPLPMQDPPRVALTPETVDSFIERAIRADSADRLRISQEISRARGDREVVRQLARARWTNGKSRGLHPSRYRFESGPGLRLSTQEIHLSVGYGSSL